MRFHLDSVLGSILLMLSLFLPLTWNFFPSDWMWSFPFLDNTTYSFSLSPIEYRTYQLRDILPLYFPFFLVPVYIASKSLIPEMVVSIGKIKIDLWMLHIAYVSLQAIDLFLSFSQSPYFRTVFIVVGVVLHLKWLLDNTR